MANEAGIDGSAEDISEDELGSMCVDDGEAEEDTDDKRTEELETAAVDDPGTEDEAEETIAEELADARGVEAVAIFVHPAGTSVTRLTSDRFSVKNLGYSTLRLRSAGPIGLGFGICTNGFLTSG